METLFPLDRASRWRVVADPKTVPVREEVFECGLGPEQTLAPIIYTMPLDWHKEGCQISNVATESFVTSQRARKSILQQTAFTTSFFEDGLQFFLHQSAVLRVPPNGRK